MGEMSARNWGISYIFWLLGTSISSAEITLDGTLGSTGSLAGPDFQIPAEVGRQVGGNLFHSFGKFSIATQESATFIGPNVIANVIGRVTGGEISQIDGLIRNQIPGADLYLINPVGIMFGPNAQLDVQGSFHTSTADFLRLGEQGRFDASQPENTVLTSAPPEAFGFFGDSPAPVSIDGSQLEVSGDKTLSIVGGDVDIGSGAKIFAPSGRINLASVVHNGEVIPREDGLEVLPLRGDITVASKSLLDVSGEGGGDIFIRAGLFTLDESYINPAAATIGGEDGGVLDIETKEIQVLNGSITRTNTGSTGRGGDTRFKVTEDFLISGVDSDGFGGIIAASTLSEAEDAGDAGMITIDAERVVVADGGLISSSSFGGGNGNTIEIRARNGILITGEDNQENFSAIIAQSSETLTSNAGNMILETSDLSIQNGAFLSTGSFGSGQGGDIEIHASGQVRISGESRNAFVSGILTTSNTNSEGSVGNLKLEAKELIISDGAGISAATFGPGDAGDIEIRVIDAIKLSGFDSAGIGSFIDNNTEGSGKGGSIDIYSDQLQLSDGAQIRSLTLGIGNGGNVQVEVKNSIDIAGVNGNGIGSGTFSETQGSGAGGNLKIQAQRINITDRGEISARSLPAVDANNSGNIALGNAGNIDLDVGDNLRMESGLVGTSTQGADGGVININSPGILLLTDSEITTSVEDEIGNGGNIAIKQPRLMVLGGSSIIANAFEGDGGNIDIVVDQLIRDPGSEIRASSELGIDGNVNIDSPDINIISGLSELPAKFSDATRFMPRPCAQRSGADVIQFVFRNYDVLPASPYALRVPLLKSVFITPTDTQVLEKQNDYKLTWVSKPMFDCQM